MSLDSGQREGVSFLGRDTRNFLQKELQELLTVLLKNCPRLHIFEIFCLFACLVLKGRFVRRPLPSVLLVSCKHKWEDSRRLEGDP